jgi:hypothetical protein
MRTHSLLRLFAVAGLALLLCGCAITSQPQSAGHALHKAKVAALVAVLALRYEQNLDDGPAYTLTELEGLNAANGLGPEGQDAATLWEQEIKRHYQNGRSTTLARLRREVSQMDDASLETYIKRILSGSNSAESNDAGRVINVRSVWFHTRTSRRAHIDAICRSLRSTPTRWARLYPDRRSFSFDRFGINHALLKRWCTRSALAALE